MKNAIIAAVVAAVVAAATGSAATILVTSKNIKNGTIQTVDISAKAKKALRGQRGPQGPAGIEELTVVNSPKFIPPGTGSSAVATCPAGQVPIAGGFASSGGITITTSAPVLADRAWIVVANATTSASLSAIAYCAKNVNLLPLG